MGFVPRSVLVASLVSWAALGTGTSARAAPPSPVPMASPAPGPLAQTLRGEALAAYQAAGLLFQDADYAGSATKYRLAYSLSNHPRLLWNVAACEKALRHYARAAALVDQFLGDAAAMLTADQVASAVATRDALQALIRPVTFHVEPPGAHVFVDDQALGESPFPHPMMVDLGAHKVRAEKPAYRPAVADLPERATSFDLALVPDDLRGQLLVRADVPSATILVDGQVVGAGRWEGRIAPGRHWVVVSTSARQERTYDLDIARGARQTLEVDLLESPASVWPWVAGATRPPQESPWGATSSCGPATASARLRPAPSVLRPSRPTAADEAPACPPRPGPRALRRGRHRPHCRLQRKGRPSGRRDAGVHQRRHASPGGLPALRRLRARRGPLLVGRRAHPHGHHAAPDLRRRLQRQRFGGRRGERERPRRERSGPRRSRRPDPRGPHRAPGRAAHRLQRPM
jgi:hypothetical protein